MWSPDGQKLAFVSQREAGGFAIFQMNMDGTNRVEITPLSNFVNVTPWGVVGFSMSWSPDGGKIAFQDPYYNDIWVVDVGTHARQNLTNDGGGQIALFDYHPAWSPDGSTILFSSPRDVDPCTTLYAINPDGTNRRRLSGDHCPAYSPSWSPDGTKIVFVQLNGEFVESELRIANSDGTNVRIFDGGYPDINNRDYPRWSPDGRTIAFNMTNGQDIEIYVKNIDGTGYAQLTNTPAGRNYRPSWQPLLATACPNPIDCNEFFVRQQYLDFLNREPDAGGLAYWTNRITECGSDARCTHERRIGVSAAFFVEMEFQETGYYIYRFYQASYGRQPTYAEFTADRAKVIGGANLEANKQAFADEWVQRQSFRDAYPITMSNTEVVNKLFDSAGLTLSRYDAQRQQEIQAMNAGRSRALILRDVIEIPDFKNIADPNDPRYSELKQISQYNPAFVLTQYFGYLHRDLDQNGYDFWLDIVNNREPNNYRGMVCSFITSSEYQLRFGSAVTRSNADCAP
jgi:Tol biopolymer transport system component